MFLSGGRRYWPCFASDARFNMIRHLLPMLVHTDSDIHHFAPMVVLDTDAVLSRVLGGHPLDCQTGKLSLLKSNDIVVIKFKLFVILKPDYFRVRITKHSASQIQGLKWRGGGGKKES